MTRLPVRERSTQAAVTSRTYRKARIDRPPPVAATTAVMRVASRRQRYHAARRGRPTEPRRSRTPEDAATTGSTTKRMPVFTLGTRSGGMRGTRTARSPASARRARTKTRRILSGSRRFGKDSVAFIVSFFCNIVTVPTLSPASNARAIFVKSIRLKEPSPPTLQGQIEPHQERPGGSASRLAWRRTGCAESCLENRNPRRYGRGATYNAGRTEDGGG